MPCAPGRGRTRRRRARGRCAARGRRRRRPTATDGGGVSSRWVGARSSASQVWAAVLACAIELSAASTSTPTGSSRPWGPVCRADASSARRRPSARRPVTDATRSVSSGVKWGRSAARRSVSAPHVVASSIRAARSSSPKPWGRRISRWRRLRSSSPLVVWLSVAARRGERASTPNALTSCPGISISAMRTVASGGSPFSTTSLVGSSVAGSSVSTQTPSKDTTRARMRAAPSEKSGTLTARCDSRVSSSRRRLGDGGAIGRLSHSPRVEIPGSWDGHPVCGGSTFSGSTTAAPFEESPYARPQSRGDPCAARHRGQYR